LSPTVDYDTVKIETVYLKVRGFVYELHSIPAIIDIICQIRKHSPEAWILNYSNPAAIVDKARNVFSQVIIEF
jgi:alpha-galactosidase/6-phospho-beta-glucosidase family protein